MRKYVLLLLSALFSLTISSQTIVGSATVLPPSGRGGEASTVTIKTMNMDIKQEKLDDATVRCAYKFIQPVKTEGETLQVSDTMILDIGSKFSIYYDAMRMKRDSVFAANMKDKLSVENIKSMSVIKDNSLSTDGMPGTSFESTDKGETSKLYKKRADGELMIVDKPNNGRDFYKCTEKEALKWNITSDTLTVLGYTCQKATTTFRGRNYEAWFTPEIPLNDGPWKFYGLPGLILKVSDDQNLFLFEIVGLENLNTPVGIFIAQQDYIKCSAKELFKLKQKTGRMGVNINGGNVTMVQRTNNKEYTPLEK